MPPQEFHLSRAKKNRDFLNCCEQSSDVKISARFGEWAIIVKFYECLHIVEAIAAPHNLHFPDHEKRLTGISLWVSLYDKNFVSRYADLYTMSKRARYYNVKISSQDVKDSDDAYVYIRNYAINKHRLAI